MKALPGIKSVTLAIKQKWDMGEPFLTWGVERIIRKSLS